MNPIHSQNELDLLNDGLTNSARSIFENLYSSNTKKAYKSDLKDFYSYLRQIGTEPESVTTNTIINYLDSLREKGRKYATIQRRLISIRSLYKQYGAALDREAQEKGTEFVYQNPASTDKLKNWMRALRNTIGTAQTQKRAANKRLMQAIINEIDGNRLIDIRNRAILALGYAGAFRRSELAALNLEDIQHDSEGIYVSIRKSKTDQEGQGQTKYIYYGQDASYCPVRLLEKWIKAASIKTGPLFRNVNKGSKVGATQISDKAIYNVIRDAAKKAGFDQSEFGGHSLRRGLITQLADDGVEERDIMRHTGHKSTITMRRYIEEVDVKKKSPTKGIL